MGDHAPKRIASGGLKPGNLALMPTLMLSIGLLVLLSAGLIVAVNWVTGRAIVQEFATRSSREGFPYRRWRCGGTLMRPSIRPLSLRMQSATVAINSSTLHLTILSAAPWPRHPRLGDLS